jgi:pimeloyl-ACP methyl ester carboxylesterase
LLIYVHGWLEPGPFVEETTLLPRIYRDLEVDVAHVQLPFHGKRNPKGALFHGEFYWSADLVRSIEALRQSVIDVRAAMLWFRTLGYQQIGVSGISLGGSIAMLLACLDPTPEYIVPIIAHLDLADAVERAPIFWRVKSDLERFGVSAERRAELFRRVGLSQMRPLLSRDRQLWVAGKQDMYLTAEVVDRQWQAWGRPQILWIDWGHMTFPVAMGEIIDQMRTFRSRLPAKG